MPHLAAAARSAPRSGIRAMLDRVLAQPGALSLIFGEPDFPTPPHIVEAAADAARAGRTGYAPAAGFPGLREAIAHKLRERNGIAAARPSQVVVTSGGTGGLFTSLSLIASPGDEVLIPDPGWPNFDAMAHVFRATPVHYTVSSATGRPDMEALERAVTPRTRVLLVNSPGNPTGVMYAKETMLELSNFASAHDLWIISDECYDEVFFSQPHVSMATVGDTERIISVFTFSKTYAMTGWRVGYVFGPAEFATALEYAQEPVVSCASSISQAAAEAALHGPQDVVAVMRAQYAKRLRSVIPLLADAGIGYIPPQGAFYLMVDISAAGLPSWEFAVRLLDEYHVGVVPGRAFGAQGEGYVRISVAAAAADLEEGVRRVVGAVRQWSGQDSTPVPTDHSH